MDYAQFGLDPNATQAAQHDAYVQAAARALEVKAQVDAETDDEDRDILTERYQDAHENAEAIRATLKMTKREAAELRHTLLDNNRRALAQQHLSLEAQRSLPGYDARTIDAQQAHLEAQINAVSALLAD